MLLISPWRSIVIYIWSFAWFISDTTALFYKCFHPIAVGLSLNAYCTNKPISATTETWQTMCMSLSFEALNDFFYSNTIANVYMALMWAWCIISSWFILHRLFNGWRGSIFSIVGIALTQSFAKRYANNKKDIKNKF